MAGDQFPEIQGGGSLILAWQVKNRPVLVVGGGEVAAGRILNLLDADAKVTLISPRDGLNDEVAHRVKQGVVTYHDKLFEPTDLDHDPPYSMVLTAVDDPVASSEVYKLCKAQRIPANIADVPPECDFYFGSIHRDGPLQIMVSTNGNGPKLASIVRKQIAANLPTNIGRAIEKVGQLRRTLRKKAPGMENGLGAKRMKWMIRVCEGWTLDDLTEMEEGDMEELVKSFQDERVPSLNDVRGRPIWEFDGSFGFM